MQAAQKGIKPDIDEESEIGQAVLYNLQPKERAAEWIDLPSALKGPLYIAKGLIQKLQQARSKPGKPYRLNAEQ